MRLNGLEAGRQKREGVRERRSGRWERRRRAERRGVGDSRVGDEAQDRRKKASLFRTNPCKNNGHFSKSLSDILVYQRSLSRLIGIIAPRNIIGILPGR